MTGPGEIDLQDRAALRRQAVGTRVEAAFVLQRVEVRTDRQGAPYLAARLSDRAGVLEARWFDVPQDVLAALPSRGPVRVAGLLDHYREAPQLLLEAIAAAVPTDEEWAQLLPRSRYDAAEMEAELVDRLAQITEPHLAALRDDYLADDVFWSRFVRAPASMRYHHATLHGLLEHTLQLLRVADAWLPLYPWLQADLVRIGLFLHDSGKAFEIDSRDGVFAYTLPGELIGHISLGLSYLDRKLREIAGFPSRLANELRHIVLSHHGREEFGSPKPPMTAEAMAVHHLDSLDSEMATLHETAAAGGTHDPHTPFVWSSRFRRRLLPPDLPAADVE